MHCAKGDVQTRLINVTYIPRGRFMFFSLHAVMQMHEIPLNPERVHILDGELAFSIRGAGSYVEARRISDVPIAPALIAPAKRMRIDIDDLHVSLAHSHADNFA